MPESERKRKKVRVSILQSWRQQSYTGATRMTYGQGSIDTCLFVYLTCTACVQATLNDSLRVRMCSDCSKRRSATPCSLVTATLTSGPVNQAKHSMGNVSPSESQQRRSVWGRTVACCILASTWGLSPVNFLLTLRRHFHFLKIFFSDSLYLGGGLMVFN